MTSRPLLIAVIAIAGITGTLQAQQTFEGCYVPAVGAIYLVNRLGLPDACLSETHMPVSWTDGGGLADSSVTGLQLATDAVATAHLQDGSVTSAKLGDDVGSTILGDGAVTMAKIADGAVSQAKLNFDPATQGELDQHETSDAHDARYPLSSVLSASGTINQGNNPIDWTQLKNVPAGLADGVDDNSGADHGSLTGLTDDDHAQYLLGNGVRTTVNGFAVAGLVNTGTIPVEGPGARLMWYPGKAALRAGNLSPPATEWNDANVGYYSTATGVGTTASGQASIAMGNLASATASNATALGAGTTASGDGATAVGLTTTASGSGATAAGSGSTAQGNFSTAMGASATASGTASIALGWGPVASGDRSTALGELTTASGGTSTALGRETTASGLYTTAMGYTTTAQAHGSVAIGQFNVVAGDESSWVATDPLLVAGNGNDASARSNALTLLKNGNLTIAGTLTQSSDIRLKEGIEPLDPVLDDVLRLTPISYRFRENTGHPSTRKIGLSAQELEQHFPELVALDARGYRSVAYAELSAVLLRAIQEQQAQINDLRAEVSALRAR
jgi:hypothetical protein